MSVTKLEPFLTEFLDNDLFPVVNTQKLPLDLAVDLYEDEANLVATMNVAGINPENMDITIEDGYLKISGTREEEKEVKNRNYYSKQISRGSFERVIPLPIEVDKDNIKAELEDGMLKVIMLKKTKDSENKKTIKISKKK